MADLLFDSSSWVLSAVVYVGGSIALCLLLFLLIRRCVPHEQLRKHHDVAGFVFSIVGVLYSVILGFTVINVQGRYTDAEQAVHTEAMALADLYRTATFFPDGVRDAIRGNLRQYVDYVLNEEWSTNKLHHRHLKTQSSIEEIWKIYGQVAVPDLKSSVCYEESMRTLDRFMDARLSRTFNSWDSLSSMMWAILLSGAFLTVCFMFFFSLESFRLQLLMTALLTGYLSFMLFLVYSLDHVYQGSQAIQPVAFKEVVVLFDQWDQE